jgi:2-polyprenyl-6-methoxyphenol hydroxylase-like FAD-dependent oxidoreductase
MKIDMYDVAIIGGGLDGSTAATLLAEAGWHAIVLERWSRLSLVLKKEQAPVPAETAGVGS